MKPQIKSIVIATLTLAVILLAVKLYAASPNPPKPSSLDTRLRSPGPARLGHLPRRVSAVRPCIRRQRRHHPFPVEHSMRWRPDSLAGNPAHNSAAK